MYKYVELIKEYALLTPEQEQALALQIENGLEADKIKARNTLVCANLRLVLKIANEYKGNGVELFELVSEGNKGLLEAASRFKPGRGSRFITFAQSYIKHYIGKTLSSLSGPVSMSSGTYNRRKKIVVKKNEMGENYTLNGLAKQCGRKNMKSLSVLLNSKNQKVPIDAYVDEDGKRTLADVAELEHQESPFEKVSFEESLDVVLRELSKFSDTERFVVEKRFGLNNDEPMTLREIGKALHLTAERIRQIQDDVIEKLRIFLEQEQEEQKVG